jgi:hypothetical protein
VLLETIQPLNGSSFTELLYGSFSTELLYGSSPTELLYGSSSTELFFGGSSTTAPLRQLLCSGRWLQTSDSVVELLRR